VKSFIPYAPKSLLQKPNINSLVKFSRDEQGSLEHRMGQINSAAFSVIHNEDWLRELLLYFVGVQPTVSFLVSTVRIFQERIWRILSVHSEFSGLADYQKKAIWRRSIPMGVAFMLVKKDSAAKGIDQLKVILISLSLPLSPSHTHTHTHTHSFLETHHALFSLLNTLFLSLTHSHTHIHILFLSLSHTHTLSLSPTYTHTFFLSHTYTHSISLTYTPSFTLFLAHTHTLSLTQTHSISHIQKLFCSHSYTHTLSLSRSHTLCRTHTLSLSPTHKHSLSLSFLHTHTNTLSLSPTHTHNSILIGTFFSCE